MFSGLSSIAPFPDRVQ
jgi:hypothetical protein